MNYLTPQELAERIGEQELVLLSDRDGGGHADEGVVEQAIQDATDEINMHLASRYQMPLPQVPDTIKRLTVSLTVYWLCEDDRAMSELIKQRYDNGIKTLKALANGTMRLGLPEAKQPEENRTGSAQVVSAERRHTRQSLGGVL